MYLGLHVKCPLFLFDSTEICTFSTDFRKTLRYQSSWKSVRRGPSSMRTDGRTDMTKLVVAFRSFAIAPKKSRENPTAMVRWGSHFLEFRLKARHERTTRVTHTRRSEGIICRKTGTICGLTIISFLVPRMCNDLLLIANKLVSVILPTDGMSMSLCSS